MAELITFDGRDYVEDAIVNGADGNVLDTIALGDGTSSPSRSDNSLQNDIFEASVSDASVTINKTSTTGEIRFTVTVTGGTEVPSGSSITEFGIKTTDGTLFYYEVRSTGISFNAGETKTVEIRIDLRDDDPGEQRTAIVDEGINLVRDILVGDSTDVMDTIAVGTLTNDVSQTDTVSDLDEVYRGNSSNSNTTIETTSNVGQPRAVLTISAGTEASDEVSGGTDIAEFGLIFSNSDTLLLHETRENAVELQTNDEKSFSVPLEIVQ